MSNWLVMNCPDVNSKFGVLPNYKKGVSNKRESFIFSFFTNPFYFLRTISMTILADKICTLQLALP